MRRAASEHLVPRLEVHRVLADEELVVLDDVLPGVEVPPLVLVVGVPSRQVAGFQVRLRELVPAEVDAPRRRDLVDRSDREVDAALVNLRLGMQQTIDDVGEFRHTSL